MKKLIVGITFIFSGLSIYLIMHQNAVAYLPQVAYWDNSLGKLGQALKDTGGLLSTRISIGLIIVGLILLAFECINEFLTERYSNKEDEVQSNEQDDEIQADSDD